MADLSQHVLFRNFGWKLLSLILAVVIWLTIRAFRNEQDVTERLFPNLSIKIVSGTADVRAFQADPPLGSVTLRGRSGLINRLDAREVHLLTDVSLVDTTQPSRHHLVVTVPNGVTVVRTEPLEVRIIPPPRSEPKIIITPPKTIE